MKDKIISIITWIIMLGLLIFAFNFYKQNNFNDYIRSEMNLHTSEFKRDSEVKYSKTYSYRITSNTENDATFCKKIKVKKNMPYKVTCMVKTENVVPENDLSGVGAQISVIGTTEKSVAITGTEDWQKIEMIFNSKNREEVNIGFRLGGYLGKCTGTAWFSDFTLEEGTQNESKNWKFACFIFENTDVTVDGNHVKLSMTDEDISDIKDTIERFESTVRSLSENKMTGDCDIYRVKTPISKLTYDDEFGYFVAAEDIEESIKEVVTENDYDHIFAIIRLGNEKYTDDIEINDWIGLGSMDYYGIGYSNIRLPNSSRSYIYKYDQRINTFPEEVFLHEFLHSLERTSEEYGYDIPALHDNQKYGYRNQNLTNLKDWYKDYMNKAIKTSNGNIGLPPEVYTLKPAKNTNFKYSYKIENEFKEPQNVIEEVIHLFKNIATNVKNISTLLGGNQVSLEVDNSI